MITDHYSSYFLGDVHGNLPPTEIHFIYIQNQSGLVSTVSVIGVHFLYPIQF